MFMDLKNQYSENEYITQSNLQIQCNPYEATNVIVHRNRTNNFTICMELQNKTKQKTTHIAKAILRKKHVTGGTTCLTSGYTTKLRSSRLYSTGTKTEMQISETKQKAQR